MPFKPPFESFFSNVDSVRKNWVWFLILGIILILLGCLGVYAAALTTLFTIFFLSGLLLAGGLTKIVYAFGARAWSGFFLSLILGILYGLAGILFLTRPIEAAAGLTLLIGSFLVLSGAFKIVSVFVVRFEHRGFVLFSGVISLILGIMVLN